MVLLFHAGLGFPGGYVGVDVFFVISGFLITGIILTEQSNGDFSIGEFWIRRIRRIVPAATVMALIVLVAGFFLLLPNDYTTLSESTICQQLMFSNVYFWRNTGYFDGPAEKMPLLHTWSLAVEEQFYLIYPFILLLLHRYSQKSKAIILTTIAVLSFAASEYGIRHHPSAAFYLLPTRAWELLVGALIWFLPVPTRLASPVVGVLGWASLSTILACGWFFTSSTPFPGLYALLPTGSTAVFIYAHSNSQSSASTILSVPLAVFVGLISYSLYLWHWPLLAFWTYWFQAPTPLVGTIAIGITFVVATLSWYFIEVPFRKRGVQRDERYAPFIVAISSAAVLVVVSAAILGGSGFPARFPQDILLVIDNHLPPLRECSLDDAVNGAFPSIGAGGADPPTILLWGDSHLRSLSDVFDKSARDFGLTGAIATRGGFPPPI